jgi:hypothetical protein
MKKYIIAAILLLTAVLITGQEHDWTWAARAGGTSNDNGMDMTFDPQGNLCVTGSFISPATFGSFTLSTGKLFVGKMSSSGNWLWVVSSTGTAGIYSYGINTDVTGNIYIAGMYSGTTQLGSITLPASANNDVFVAKLSSNGTWLWAVTGGGPEFDSAYDVTLSGGNIFICGVYTTSASFGSTSFSQTVAGNYNYIAKLDLNGNWLNATGNTAGYCEVITSDSAANLYVSGKLIRQATFGSFTLPASNHNFFGKLDSSLNWIWAVHAGGSASTRARDITLDADGNIFVTGYFTGNGTFWNGSDEFVHLSDYEIFITKLDNYGNGLWARRAGGTGYDQGACVAADTDGNVYLGGQNASPSGDYGSFTVIPPLPTQRDAYVAKLNSDGDWLWLRQFGGWQENSVTHMISDNSANLYLTGSFNGTATLGTASITSAGLNDAFFARLGAILPASPADFSVGRSGADVLLSWDAVTTNNNGQPLSPDYYDIYSSVDAQSGFEWLGQSIGTTFTDSNGAMAERRFYRVKAVKN